MATNFPGALDSFSTKTSGDTISESHINDPQDSIEALEVKLAHTIPETVYRKTVPESVSRTASIGDPCPLAKALD